MGQISTKANSVYADKRGGVDLFPIKSEIRDLFKDVDAGVSAVDAAIAAAQAADGDAAVAGALAGGQAGLNAANAALDFYPIYLDRYFTGNISNHDDVTTAMLLARDAMVTRVENHGSAARTIIPTMKVDHWIQLSETITLPVGGIGFEGSGKFTSNLRRSGDYGDTFIISDPDPSKTIEGCIIKNIGMFHDNGGTIANGSPGSGFPVSIVPGSWTNLVSADTAHIRLVGAHSTEISGCLFNNLPYGIHATGGSLVQINNNVFMQVWDRENASLQQGIASILLQQGDQILTWYYLRDNSLNGQVRTDHTVTFPGGFVRPNTAYNIGGKYGIVISGGEDVVTDGNYTGGHSYSSILFNPDSGDVCKEIWIGKHYWDPAGVGDEDAAVRFSPTGTGQPRSIYLQGYMCGASNGTRAITDVNSATSPSVFGLRVECDFDDYVCNPIDLSFARMVNFNGSSGSNWNYYGAYSPGGPNPDASLSSAAHIGAGCRNINFTGGNWGGDQQGLDGGSNHCQDVVRADNGVVSNVKVDINLNAISGRAYVGGINKVRINASTTSGSLTAGEDSPSQVYVNPLSSDITITLLPSVPTGDEAPFEIRHAALDAFNLNVDGGALGVIALSGGECGMFRPFNDYAGTYGWVLVSR